MKKGEIARTYKIHFGIQKRQGILMEASQRQNNWYTRSRWEK
jgi:hypothetical protein